MPRDSRRMRRVGCADRHSARAQAPLQGPRPTGRAGHVPEVAKPSAEQCSASAAYPAIDTRGRQRAGAPAPQSPPRGSCCWWRYEWRARLERFPVRSLASKLRGINPLSLSLAPAAGSPVELPTRRSPFGTRSGLNPAREPATARCLAMKPNLTSDPSRSGSPSSTAIPPSGSCALAQSSGPGTDHASVNSQVRRHARYRPARRPCERRTGGTHSRLPTALDTEQHPTLTTARLMAAAAAGDGGGDCLWEPSADEGRSGWKVRGTFQRPWRRE